MSWALKSERVGRFHKLAGSKFQTVGAMKLKEWLRNTESLEEGKEEVKTSV